MEDYYQVAPRYGTNQDLVDLFEEAHKRNMHVLLDLVPGHTSITHAWFKESAQPKKNAYTDRYIWTNSVKKMMDDVDGIASVLRGFWQRGVLRRELFFLSAGLKLWICKYYRQQLAAAGGCAGTSGNKCCAEPV